MTGANLIFSCGGYHCVSIVRFLSINWIHFYISHKEDMEENTSVVERIDRGRRNRLHKYKILYNLQQFDSDGHNIYFHIFISKTSKAFCYNIQPGFTESQKDSHETLAPRRKQREPHSDLS